MHAFFVGCIIFGIVFKIAELFSKAKYIGYDPNSKRPGQPRTQKELVRNWILFLGVFVFFLCLIAWGLS
jgi:hypothetical protein